MRTRFLPIDFFHLTSNQTLETENVDIFRLPAPLIDPPNLQFEFNFDDLDFVDGVSCELELLPIGNALSHFLSDSLPCVIECENGEFPVIWRGVGGEDESNANGQVFRSGRKEFEISQKESGVLHGDTKAKKQSNLSYKNPEKEVQNCSGLVVEFEVPEVWENAKPCEKEEIICVGFPEVEIPLDDVKTKFGDTIPYSSQVLKSIYSVEDITTEFNMAQASYYVDPSSVQESTVVYTCKILNFEIPKVGFELYACSSIKEELQLLLSNLPPCCWAKNDELRLNFKENFQMKDVNILECLSNQGAADKFLELRPTCLDSLLEMDPISDGQCFSILSKFHLDEVQILDLDYFQPIENYASGLELEALEQMCGESINSIGCFYDNIVDTELALMDDTFVSFPIPVFCDRNDMMHLPSTLNGIIAGLKPHFETACDEIYLDWRLLRKDTSSSVVSSADKDILKEVDTYDSYESSPEPQSTYWKMIFDLIFCDATPDDLTTLKPKDEINKLHGAISAYSEPLLEIKPSQLIEKQKSGNGEPVLTAKSNNGSFISESMSQFNDLSFFLDPLNGTTGGKLEEIIQMSDNLVAAPVGSSTNPIVVSPQKTSRLWDVEVHQVKLSHHILSLIDSIQKCYFSIVENDTDLGKKYSSPEGEFQLLRLPKQKLWDLITNVSSDEAETFIAYVSLYVIKQMVHYLCFFGIHTAHLYLSSLSQKLKYLRVKLRLHPLIEDAHWKAEKGLIESHPSLSIVGEVLKSNTCKSAKRMLIVADRVYWWPLKRKLTSLSISFNEVGKCPTRLNQVHSLGSEEFSNAIMESGCLLTSHDHISSSFPFHKFSVILEYGGSCGSSNISTICLNLAGLPYVYFFKVQLEDCSVPRAFCEGFDVGQYPNFKMGGVSQQMPIIQESVNRQQLLELLNFVPVSENDYTGTAEASHQPTSVSSIPFPLDSIERMKSTTHSSPNTVIIVNTLSFDKEMLMFRRSSYEKIIAMEKSGIQVVEREFNLPVDLIFGSGICLIWYNASGFVAIEKDYSSIPEYMENIAVNILMSLSFAFRECILVFEGENVFLDGVKEWSDGLYAAAATLDMRLQPFFSYSPELTDEIIMSCVNDATKLNRGLYPPMSDSETLGESFLTAFPSINPLSAHAILSSGGMLVDFLGWSHEQCVQAIQKLSIPLESISLFSILCKYGEIVESKSGTTECPSSVSSALDSDYSCNKMQSKRKNLQMEAGTLNHWTELQMAIQMECFLIILN